MLGAVIKIIREICEIRGYKPPTDLHKFHELVLTFLNRPILRGSEMEIFTWKW